MGQFAGKGRFGKKQLVEASTMFPVVFGMNAWITALASATFLFYSITRGNDALLGGFIKDRVTRRRFVKSRILPYLPLPWTWRLIYMYIIRAGFLDGRAGWELSNFISSYEFFIQMKYQELRRLRGRPVFAHSGLAQPEGQISFRDQTGVAAALEEPPVDFNVAPPSMAKVAASMRPRRY